MAQENKQNDIVAVMQYNPSISLNDLEISGVDGDNTGIKNEEDYYNYKDVTDSPQFKDDNGNFSKAKFHTFYQGAVKVFNYLSQDHTVYDKSNIFAPTKQRDWSPQFKITKLDNPDEVTQSFIKIGEQGPKTMSVEEIAQTQPVWDDATKSWKESPNSSFLGAIKDGPMFLATYDQNVDDNGNPTSDPSKIVHHKGEYKLNNNGTYYYETANGRNITGKDVLHLSDILTTDGSALNSIDFLDSDGLQKSPVGSLMKNIALVGSMFIPYVGPWIAAAGLAEQSMSLVATLGKMAMGSDSPSMNTLQGISAELNSDQSKSEYSKEHMWSWENMIDMVGSVIGQLKQQRILFNYAPAIFKGNWGKSEEAQKELQDKLFSKYLDAGKEQLSAIDKNNNLGEWTKVFEQQKINASMNAQADVENYMKQYYHIGGAISKAYMTGITVNDIYDESKQAGASDNAAASLTLGYAAAEAILLNTGLGERFLPELRAARQENGGIIKALGKNAKDIYSQLETQAETPEQKVNFFKKMFNIGKTIANADYSVAQKTAFSTAANAVGEGAEEVSEDILADAFRGIYNLSQWMQGNQSRMQYSDAKNLYLMDFLGGATGGAFTGLTMDSKAFKSFNNMDDTTAIKRVIEKFRSGQGNELYNAIDQVELGNSKLSATETNKDDNGNVIGWKQGTADDNQDLYIKSAIKNQLYTIENTLKATGASLDNKSLLSANTLHDLRFSSLYNTATAGRLIESFDQKVSDLVQAYQNLGTLNSPEMQAAAGETDKKDGKNASLEKQRKDSEEVIKNITQEIQDIKDGYNAGQFMQDALLEVTPSVLSAYMSPTFQMYAESVSGKPYNTLSNNDIDALKINYNEYIKGQKKDDISIASKIHTRINDLAKDNFIKQVKQLDLRGIQDPLTNGLINTLTNLQAYARAVNYKQVSAEEYTNLIQSFSNNIKTWATDILNKNNPSYKESFENILNTPITEQYTAEQQNQDIANLVQDNLVSSLSQTANQLKKIGFLNPVAKQKFQYITELAINDINQTLNPPTGINYFNILNDYLYDYNGLSRLKEDLADPNNPDSEDLNSLLSNKLHIDINQYNNIEDLKNDVLTKKAQLQENVTTLQNSISDINNLPNTPITQFLNQFGLDVTGKDINIENLLGDLNNRMQESVQSVGDFDIQDQNIQNRITQANKLIKVFRGWIEAAKTTGAGLNMSEDEKTGMMIRPDFNLFGINKTINDINKLVPKKEGQKYNDLVTIDGETADALEQDLNLYDKTLGFYTDLYNINAGQKLSLQHRIGINLNYLLYNNLNNFTKQISKSGWDTSKLKQAINNASTTRNLIDGGSKLSLSPDEENTVESDKINMEDAIYDFFNDNLKDSNKKLSDVINADTLNLYTSSSDLLTEKLDNIDDNSMLWYLASRAAVKSSQFYSNYKNIINNKIAPLPGQENAEYLAYASIVNGDMISKFAKTAQQSLINEWKSLSVDQRKQKLSKLNLGKDNINALSMDSTKDFAWNNSWIPKFLNTVFIEGVPGSGKTKAVANVVLSMLGKYHPDILNNVHVINVTNESAQDIIDSNNIENAKAFNKEQYLKKIVPDYQVRKTNSNGVYEYSDKDIMLTEDGHYTYSKSLTNDKSDIPSLILVDEVSRFTDPEMQALDDYASQNGIQVLSFGDLNQSQAKAQITIKDIPGFKKEWEKSFPNIPLKNNNFTNILQIYRNNFIHPFKLGTSIRTSNKQINENMSEIQAIQTNQNQGRINLHYFENDNQIQGTKISGVYEPIIEQQRIKYVLNQDQIPKILKDVDKLISNLDDKEKIGYIYYDDNSPLAKVLLNDEKYKNYIDPHQGNSAQGLEGNYYIVESNLGNNNNTTTSPEETESFLQDLYTGITRSKVASLVVVPSQNYGTIKSISNKQDIDSSPEEITDQSISDYSNRRKNLLNNIITDVQPEELINRIPNEIIKKARNPNQVQDDEDNRDPNLFKLNSDVSTEIDDNKNTTYNFAPTQMSQSWISKYNPNDDNHTILTKIMVDPQSRIHMDLKSKDGEYIHITSNDSLEKITDNLLTYVPVIQATENYQEQQTINSNLSDGKELSNIQDKQEELQDLQNRKQDGEEPMMEGNGSPKNMNQMLFSFNTFELGGFHDQNGILVPDNPNYNQYRIDSLNGLMKISTELSYYGYSPLFPENKPTLDRTNELLGLLRSAATNDMNISDLNNDIKGILNLPNTWDVNVKFALKSSGTNRNGVGYPNINYKDPQYRRFQKNTGEMSQFNNASFNTESTGKDPRLINLKNIALEVKIRHNGQEGYSLELPLLTLNSPLTLINLTDGAGNYIYKEVRDIFTNGHSSLQDSIHKGVMRVIQQAGGINPDMNTLSSTKKEFLKNNKSLINLFKIYNFTDDGIYFINNTNKNFENWTIKKDLKSYGIQLDVDKGGLQWNNNYKYSSQYIPISEFSKNKNLNISDILISRTGYVQNSDNDVYKIVQKGHPFVLITDNKNIDRSNLLNQYINQYIDYTKNKKPMTIKLAYILPPSVGVDEYVDSLCKFVKDSKTNKPIGNNFTPFRVMQTLFVNDENYMHELFVKRFEDRGLFEKVKDSLNHINSLSPDAGEDYSEQLKALQSIVDWNTEGGLNNKSIQSQLQYIFRKLYYPDIFDINNIDGKSLVNITDKDTNVADRFQKIFDDSKLQIFHHISMEQNEILPGFRKAIVDDNPSGISYSINGKDCSINAKITTPTYLANNSLNEFLDDVVENRMDFSGTITGRNKNNKETYEYLYQNSEQPRPMLQYSNNVIDSLSKLGLSLNTPTLDGKTLRTKYNLIQGNYKNTESLLLGEAVNIYNTTKAPSTNKMAILVGNKVYLSQESKSFIDGPITLNKQLADNTVTDLEVKIGNTNYTASYSPDAAYQNSNTLTISPVNQVNEQVELNMPKFPNFGDDNSTVNAFITSNAGMIFKPIFSQSNNDLVKVQQILFDRAQGIDTNSGKKNKMLQGSIIQAYNKLGDSSIQIKEYMSKLKDIVDNSKKGYCPISYILKFI